MKFLMFLFVFSSSLFARDFYQTQIEFQSSKIVNDKVKNIQHMYAGLFLSDDNDYCEVRAFADNYDDIFPCKKIEDNCFAISARDSARLVKDDLNIGQSFKEINPLVFCQNAEKTITLKSNTDENFIINYSTKVIKSMNAQSYGFSVDELTHENTQKDFFVKMKLVLSNQLGDKIITEMKGSIKFENSNSFLYLKTDKETFKYSVKFNSKTNCYDMQPDVFDRMIFYDFGKTNYLPLDAKKTVSFCVDQEKRLDIHTKFNSEIFHFFYKAK